MPLKLWLQQEILFERKKKTDFKSVFENLFCLWYSGRNFGNGVIRACPLNVKNIVKREGQYNKFFSHKESKVTK